MAHFALSDLAAKKFHFRERINRGYDDKAGAATDRYLVWNEDWKVEGDERNHAIQVNDRGTQLRLAPQIAQSAGAARPKWLESEGRRRGTSVLLLFSDAHANRRRADDQRQKEKVRGLTWMDHEFGSNQLREDQVGWDWFSIQLDNQTELMLYLMRRKDGSVDPYSSGTLVGADGTTKHFELNDYRVEVLERWKSPKSGADLSDEVESDRSPRNRLSWKLLRHFPTKN